jgi:hypothetical protein
MCSHWLKFKKSSSQKPPSQLNCVFIENHPDSSYQVSDHLAKRFQRRRFLEIDHSETKLACGGWVRVRRPFVLAFHI